MAGSTLLEFDLAGLLSVKSVAVVQSVNLAGLEALLRQLVTGHQAAQHQLEEQRRELDALQQQHAEQKKEDPAGRLAHLQDQINHLSEQLQALQSVPHSPTAASQLDSAGSGGAREGSSSTSTTPSERAASDVPAASSDTAAASTAATAKEAADATQAELQELKQHQLVLEQELAGLKGELSTVAAGIERGLAALQAGAKADMGQVQALLAEGLGSKADAGDMQQLRAQLQGKADRSELDVLVDSLATPGAGPGAACRDENASSDAMQDSSGAGAGSSASTGSAPGSRRGTGDLGNTAAAADVAQQVAKLQLQLALLQERTSNKADAPVVAELADSLSTARQQLAQLQLARQQLTHDVSSVQEGLAGLRRDSLNSHARDAGPSVPPGSSGVGDGSSLGDHEQAPGGESSPAAVPQPQHTTTSTTSNSSARGELPLQMAAMMARLAALEAAMQSLREAAATATAAVVPQAPQRRVSGEAPASGKLVQCLAGQLSELRAQVARLSATGARQQGQNQQGQGQEACVAAGGGYAGACGAVGGDLAAAGELTAGSGGGGGGLDAAFAADLDARLAGLEVVVQDLVAGKADGADVHGLRDMLTAVAATHQADTGQLHHQLQAQQAALGRILSQLAPSGSSTAAAASSRPASAASHHSRGSRAPSATGLAGVGPEASFMLAAAPGGLGGGDGGLGRHELGAGMGSGGGGAAGSADGAGIMPSSSQHADAVRRMAAQLHAHQHGIEQLAAAVSLLASGKAAPSGAAAGAVEAPGWLEGEDGVEPQTPSFFSFGPPGGAAAELGGAGWAPGPGGAAAAAAAGTGLGGPSPSAVAAAEAGLVPVPVPGPQLARLAALLQAGQVGHKMDFFDPTLLQKMAQRLAAAEAVLRNGGGSGSDTGVAAGSGGGRGRSGGGADVDARLRRVAADVRRLYEKLADLSGQAGVGSSAQGGWGQRSADGDNSMLSGKPLGGYRCMACDRPLASLVDRQGPHIPTGQMTVSVSVARGAELAAAAAAPPGKVPPGTASGRRTSDAIMVSTAGSAARPMTPSSTAAGSAGAAAAGSGNGSPGADASKRAVGPQNWFASAHGPPAEQLRKDDVGPHLPPGGWRGTQPRAEDGAVLPVLMGPPRRASTSGSGGTAGGSPRAGTAAAPAGSSRG